MFRERGSARRLLHVDYVGDRGHVYYRTVTPDGWGLLSAVKASIEVWRELAPEQLEADG